MMREIVIDTRELPSPEPLERVVNALAEVTTGNYIKMVHRMEPLMLFPILKNNGFEYVKKPIGEEIEVYIFLKDDAAVRTHVEAL